MGLGQLPRYEFSSPPLQPDPQVPVKRIEMRISRVGKRETEIVLNTMPEFVCQQPGSLAAIR